MKRIEITTTFSGDPDNTGHATRRFMADTSEELSDAYADLLISKGLARAIPDSAATAASAAVPPVPSLPPAPPVSNDGGSK